MNPAEERYVHSYHAREGRRLHDQANALEELIHGGTAYPAGSAVLEIGCGVGAQTEVLARRHPDAYFTAVDLSAASLAAARSRAAAARLSNVEFLQADVYALPFSANRFDHAFVCFVLEHLPDPAAALRALRPLLREGGSLTIVEGDHGSTYFHPDCADARAAIDCQVKLQRRRGGDAMIGRRLYPILVQAGYADIAVQPRMVYVDGGRPQLAEAFTRNTFAAMIAGIGNAAIAEGLIGTERFAAGLRGLERTAQHDGVFCYTFFKAAAVRRADPSRVPGAASGGERRPRSGEVSAPSIEALAFHESR